MKKRPRRRIFLDSPRLTWEYDGTDWIQINTSTSPGFRIFSSIAYHQSNQRVVLFGGDRSGVFLNDTWELITSTNIMASFVVEEAKIDFKKKTDDDKIHVKGKFELGSDNDGIDVLNDTVMVTIKSGDGVFTETIVMYEKGHKWEYKRPKEEKDGKGIKDMKIDWKHFPEAKFEIKIDNWDLSGFNDSSNVIISIQIGNDKGSENILMKEHKHHWDYHKKK